MSAINFHKHLTEIRKELRESDDPTYNPYSSRHGQDGTIAWATMAQFPERIRNFQLGYAYSDAGFPVAGMYDFSQLAGPSDEARATFVDIGGGQGHAISEILKTLPKLEPKRMVLQDLPPLLEQVKAEKSLPEDVQIMVYDFWTPQPVKSAKAYYLRRTLHDYSDKKRLAVLKNT